MQIDSPCGLCSSYHCWDMHLSLWIRFSSLDCTVLSLQEALPCPLHAGESFLCTLICWVQTITCQESRLLPGKPAPTGLSCLGETWGKKVGRSRLHSNHLAQSSCEAQQGWWALPERMLLSAGCPEHTAWRQGNNHTNFITLDSCPRSPALCFHGSLCPAKAVILSGLSFTASWATVIRSPS